MKNSLVIIFLTAFMVFSMTVGASDAKSDEASQQIDADLAFMIAPLKSKSDVVEYVKNIKKAKSPLHLLSKSARNDFLNSLTFNDSGLTSFDYSGLESELTPSQIYQVLALFGSQSVTPMIKSSRIETELDREIVAGHFSNSVLTSSKCFMEPNSINPQSKTCPGPSPINGYYCEKRATCAVQFSRLCMPSC